MKSCKKKKKAKNIKILVKNWKLKVWCSCFIFFLMWTAKHLVQASCTEFTLCKNILNTASWRLWLHSDLLYTLLVCNSMAIYTIVLVNIPSLFLAIFSSFKVSTFVFNIVIIRFNYCLKRWLTTIDRLATCFHQFFSWN